MPSFTSDRMGDTAVLPRRIHVVESSAGTRRASAGARESGAPRDRLDTGIARVHIIKGPDTHLFRAVDESCATKGKDGESTRATFSNARPRDQRESEIRVMDQDVRDFFCFGKIRLPEIPP